MQALEQALKQLALGLAPDQSRRHLRTASAFPPPDSRGSDVIFSLDPLSVFHRIVGLAPHPEACRADGWAAAAQVG